MSKRDSALVATIKDADALLQRFGIEDRIRVKFRKTPDPDWLGQYRSRSQFSSGGPIFWVNANAHAESPRVRDELVRTILHEYGHVIWEWAKLRNPKLWDTVTTVVMGDDPDDEEEFAETFAIVVFNNAASPAYRAIAKAYNKDIST